MGGVVRKVKRAAEDVLEGAVKVGTGVVENTVVNPVRAAGNIGSGLLTGNTEKVKSGILNYGKDVVRSSKTSTAGAMQAGAGALTIGATPITGGQVSFSSKGNILGDTRSAGQVRADARDAEAAAEEKRLADEEAARPEKERQAFFNKQYENSLLRNKGRGYNSLLGGGY